MAYINELTNIVNNMEDLPYGEIIKFATEIDKKICEEIRQREDEIDQLKKNYHIFMNKYTVNKPQKITVKESQSIVSRTIGGIIINCPVITNYRDAIKYPYKPCCMVDVEDWYFIAFPEIGQILPVTHIDDMFNYKQCAQYTRINFNLFNNIDPFLLANSQFAVFPFTKSTWDIFNKIDRKKWVDYLRQINICKITQNTTHGQYFAVNSTEGLSDIVEDIKPEQMALQWGAFAQMYFILYLFKIKAGKEHFTI